MGVLPGSESLRRLRLRYPAKCSVCGIDLAQLLKAAGLTAPSVAPSAG
jgi:hypothetical protein